MKRERELEGKVLLKKERDLKEILENAGGRLEGRRER